MNSTVNNAPELVINCGRKVLFAAIGIAVVILIGGALNLYAEMWWNMFYMFITLSENSLWIPLILGIISMIVASWGICVACQVQDDKENENLLAISCITSAIFSVLWFSFFCCAIKVGGTTLFENLHGYLLIAYCLIWAPIAAVVIGFLALVIAHGFEGT